MFLGSGKIKEKKKINYINLFWNLIKLYLIFLNFKYYTQFLIYFLYLKLIFNTYVIFLNFYYYIENKINILYLMLTLI